MFEIIFQIENGEPISVSANQGDNLLEVARSSNVAIDAPCSGNASCGKCRVKLLEGDLDSLQTAHISQEDYDAGWRLACLATITGDAEIEVPDIASAYRSRMKMADLSSPEEIAIFEDLRAQLEAAGKLDKTLIVATGDHIPYFNVDTLEELSGQTFGSSKDMESLNEKNINFDVYKNSLILWSASMEEPVIVDKPCCQVDILPTVSNLLGLEYDSRMLAGADALSDSEGLVIFSSRCWKSDRGFYNRYTGEFTPAEGLP